MPPLIVFALGVMGATVLVRWCVKEVHRVNSELDDVRAKRRRAARPQRIAEAQARSEDRRIPAGVGHSGSREGGIQTLRLVRSASRTG